MKGTQKEEKKYICLYLQLALSSIYIKISMRFIKNLLEIMSSTMLQNKSHIQKLIALYTIAITIENKDKIIFTIVKIQKKLILEDKFNKRFEKFSSLVREIQGALNKWKTSNVTGSEELLLLKRPYSPNL